MSELRFDMTALHFLLLIAASAIFIRSCCDFLNLNKRPAKEDRHLAPPFSFGLDTGYARVYMHR